MPPGENDIKETTLDNFEKVSWTVLCISRTSYNIMVCGQTGRNLLVVILEICVIFFSEPRTSGLHI